MKRSILILAALALLFGGVQKASASHVFAENGNINGILLASGNAFTDPTISVTVGQTITLHFDVFSTGGTPSTFNISFADAGGSTTGPSPTNASFNYNGSGTFATPVGFDVTFSFATPGTFNGTVQPDLTVSFPDYRMPDGSQQTEPIIPFTIQVAADTAVPEPATLTLLGFGIAGLAGYGWRKRKQAVTV